MRPMLAAQLKDLSKIRYPALATPKLDGIRCLIVDGCALTRKLLPVPNRYVREYLEANCPDGWDGELMLPAPATFQQISSTFMSQDKVPPEDWFFAVFDWAPRLDTVGTGRGKSGGPPAGRRYLDLRAALGPGSSPVYNHVRRLIGRIIRDESELLAFEAEAVGRGDEGIMLRDPQSPYKYGRSTEREGWLLKLKRFDDGEAEVIGAIELQHNDNEAQVDELGLTKRSHAKAGKRGGAVLGALVVRDLQTGIEFEIGSGFTASQRTAFWIERPYLPRRIAKYKHFARSGVKTKPRHPVFLGWRAEEDMDP